MEKEDDGMKILTDYLNENKVEYEIIEHSVTIKSAEEGADFFGIEVGQTAPTLILKTDLGYYSLIISGDYGRVDMASLKKLLQVQTVRLAKPKEVEETTGSQIGNISLINPQIPTIIDRELHRFSYIYGGTGKIQSTLKIRPKDVEKLNHVVGYIR